MSLGHTIRQALPFVVGVVVVLAAVSYFSREHYVPEFLDQTNVKRTQEKSVSSYDQSTNAVKINGHFDAPPIQGMESPFRVNQFNSYIP
jgi:hypothetical protein